MNRQPRVKYLNLNAMKSFETKQFRVDAGLGKIHPNCPYSCYEDGHDVKDFVTPPKGYILTGFKLEPEPDFGSYDGRLVAQYGPKPKNPKTKMYWIGGVAGFLVLVAAILLIGVSKSNKPAPTEPEPIVMDATSNYLKILDTTTNESEETEANATVAETETNESNVMIAQAEVSKVEETPKIEEQPKVIETPKVVEQPKVKETPAETKEEVRKTEEPKKAEDKVVKEQNNAATTQAAQTNTADKKAQFHKEFWTLIHRQEKNMKTYHELYSEYKNAKLRSKEFFYLYLTILENTKQFNAWRDKLVQIPADEIKNINTVSALQDKIEQYE